MTTASTPVRPWQGTTLGVLSVIGTVLLFLIGIVMMFGGTMFTTMMSGMSGSEYSEFNTAFDAGIEEALNEAKTPEERAMIESMRGMNPQDLEGVMGGAIQGVMIGMGIIFILLGVLYIFVSRAIFIGQKWGLIVALVFSSLGALSILGGEIIIAGVNIFMIVLAVMCLKDPFYQAKSEIVATPSAESPHTPPEKPKNQ